MSRNPAKTRQQAEGYQSDIHMDDARLAQLASGGDATGEEDRHFASCRECFTAYAELVRCRDESELRGVEAPPELLRLGHVTMDRLASSADSHGDRSATRSARGTPDAGTARSGRSSRSMRRLAWAPALALAAVVLLMLMRGMGPSGLPEDPVLQPVRAALVVESEYGLVNPLVADLDPGTVRALRGVDAQPLNAGEGPLQESITALLQRYREQPESVETALWLVSAMQADGQSRNARAYLGQALERHPQDAQLQMLQILQSYQEGDLAGAEEALRARIALDPDDELAQRNLERLMAERG